MGTSRIDRIRKMSTDIKTGKAGARSFSWGLGIMAAAGVWAIVRLVIAILYFF